MSRSAAATRPPAALAFAVLGAALVAIVGPPVARASSGDSVRVLVLEPTGARFKASDRGAFANLIANALSRRPEFEVVTHAEVKKLLKLEAQRQAVGCDETDCLKNLAKTMSARLVVFTQADQLGKEMILTLTAYDSVEGKNVGRATARGNTLESLPSRLRVAVDALIAPTLEARRKALFDRDHMTCPSDMVRIPAGRFFMGADDDEEGLKNAKPSHNVTLSSFCIDRTEVTVAAYEACSKAGACRRASSKVSWPKIKPDAVKRYSPLCNVGQADKANHPINCVSWTMADRFCREQGKRLPTEAEWEFAARGPDGRRYPCGDDVPTAEDLNACGAECVAWGKANGTTLRALFSGDDGYAGTSPVGAYPAGASRFGPVDVVGNVWEWVADRYGPYTEDDVTDPVGPATGERRVMRGGAFNGWFARRGRATNAELGEAVRVRAVV